MPDTERSRDDLVAILASNAAGEITAQDLRDFLVSALGGYASIYVEDGAVAQTVDQAAAKLTGFAANGAASGCTPDHTQDQIALNTIGRYLVDGTFSLSGTADRTVQLRARLNGLEVAGVGGRCKFNASGDVATLAFGGVVIAAAPGDELTVWAEADVDGTSITLVDGNLTAKRIG